MMRARIPVTTAARSEPVLLDKDSGTAQGLHIFNEVSRYPAVRNPVGASDAVLEKEARRRKTADSIVIAIVEPSSGGSVSLVGGRRSCAFSVQQEDDAPA
jgi:hypothetical protein